MHRMHAKASPASKHQRKMQTMGLVSAEEKVKRGGDCRCGGGRHFEVWWWPIVRSDAFLERKHPASVIVALSCLSLDWVSVILAFLLFMRSEYTREKISRFLPGYRRNSREGGNPVVFWEKISINTEDKGLLISRTRKEINFLISKVSARKWKRERERRKKEKAEAVT